MSMKDIPPETPLSRENLDWSGLQVVSYVCFKTYLGGPRGRAVKSAVS